MRIEDIKIGYTEWYVWENKVRLGKIIDIEPTGLITLKSDKLYNSSIDIVLIDNLFKNRDDVELCAIKRREQQRNYEENKFIKGYSIQIA